MSSKHQNAQVSLDFLVPQKACMDILQDMAYLRVEENKRAISAIRSAVAKRLQAKVAMEKQQNEKIGNAIKNARSLGTNELLKSSIIK